MSRHSPLGMLALTASLVLAPLLGGCAPEPGSPAWCDKMKQKPKGEWTGNEAKEFAKGCLFPPST